MLQFPLSKPAGKLLAIICLGIAAVSCTGEPEKPDTDSDSYDKAVSDFYVSLAAVQSDQTLFALEKMQEVTDAYPMEAAAWANLGVFSMRQGAFDAATERLEKAVDLAPENDDILFLRGLLESRKGNIEDAINYLEQAVEKNGDNPQILYALADELERQDSAENSARIIELLNKILEEDPDNLAVLLETVRIASKWGDRELLEEALLNLNEQSENWPEQIQQQFAEQQEAILEKKGENIMFELAFLRNNLNELPAFQQDLAKVQLPSNEVGFLISEFLWLPSPGRSAAPADTAISFDPGEANLAEWARLIKPIALGDEESAAMLLIVGNDAIVNGKYRLSFPGEYNNSPGPKLPAQSVTTIDYNYDFLNDIAMAGTGGLAIYRQQSDSSFSNVTGDLQIPDSIRRQSYHGVWSYDVDSDGDLDLLLAPVGESLIVLRNNGDDTFSTQNYFEGLENVKDIIWADFDIDGDPDAVFLLEDGNVNYFENQRAGEFVRNSAFSFPGFASAISFGDLDGNGLFEVIALTSEGIEANHLDEAMQDWNHSLLIDFEGSGFTAEDGRLFVNDLDNNSSLDIIVSSGDETRYWLSDETLSFSDQSQQVDLDLFGLADTDGDLRLDLLGFAGDSKPVVMNNSGSMNYNARILRPRASGGLGDKRINSFGIGGEIEARSGIQYTKQPIIDPWVHVGLGTHDEAEMVRIIWPNGSVQAEFAELGYDSKIMNEQILKGSCPWVFTHNGEEMEFVTDFLWRTALGLRINAQGDASVIHSIDWIKIDGSQLKPKDGYYDVRITADLWETHFFDHVSLIAVDRPEDTEVFVDERFTIPAPEQKLYPVKEVFPVSSARDQDGRDVTGLIRERDGSYLDTFNLTEFQGLAEEHYVEVDISEASSENDNLLLIASGWIYPTDSSINVAISQGRYDAPQGIRVEVPDGKGGWIAAEENVGFPTGKNKTMLVDLEDIFVEGTERKVRLYTNMEIYWDQLQVGVKETNPQFETHEIAAETAELRYRGYSSVERPGRFVPEKPDYQQISGTTPKWFDLVGFYTRFGDVKELTGEIDDRYVIMNAGDELVFRFPAPPPPAGGWKRDYVLVGDGWVKDGDLNTGFSKTVIPLPYHGMEDYSEEPGRLQDDPVYQRFTEDWVNYHTRFVTPKNFSTALRFRE